MISTDCAYGVITVIMIRWTVPTVCINWLCAGTRVNQSTKTHHVSSQLDTRAFCTTPACLARNTDNVVKVGDKASVTKLIDRDVVQDYMRVSLDDNPVHFDEEYAKTTHYKRPIVQGILTASLISGAIGTHLPGTGTVLLSSNLKYVAPLYVGEEVKAEVEVMKVEGRRLLLKGTCTETSSNRVVVEAEIQALAPKHKVRPSTWSTQIAG